jgi:hypothetical protein
MIRLDPFESGFSLIVSTVKENRVQIQIFKLNPNFIRENKGAFDSVPVPLL